MLNCHRHIELDPAWPTPKVRWSLHFFFLCSHSSSSLAWTGQWWQWAKIIWYVISLLGMITADALAYQSFLSSLKQKTLFSVVFRSSDHFIWFDLSLPFVCRLSHITLMACKGLSIWCYHRIDEATAVRAPRDTSRLQVMQIFFRNHLHTNKKPLTIIIGY